MKILPYAEILKSSPEQLEATLAPSKVKEMNATAELHLAKIETKLIQAQNHVQKLLMRTDLNFNAILEAKDQVDLIIHEKEQMEELVKALFPKK